MSSMLSGELGDAETAAFLIALKMKEATAQEIASAALSLRGHMVRWDTGQPGALDTCGTGGDGSGTFNISTATAFVVAAAEVPVVKHGNRSVSSRSGSADVLAALGVPIDGDPQFARRCLDQAGLAFCFAPVYHPALKNVAGVRRRLGVSTLFNCLGPLLNPAGVQHQLLGVGRREWLEPMAGALAVLGVGHALLVCGAAGLDEVSLSGPTEVREIRGHEVTSWECGPEDFGLAPCEPSELQASGPEESARIITAVLTGQEGPASRIVLANAAAALLAADQVECLTDGIARARAAIASGRAAAVLETLRSLRPREHLREHDTGTGDRP
jgi:anthranilate phosphoribosyltransferase